MRRRGYLRRRGTSAPSALATLLALLLSALPLLLVLAALNPDLWTDWAQSRLAALDLDPVGALRPGAPAPAGGRLDPAGRDPTPAATPAAFTPFWVAATGPATLWSNPGPDAVAFGEVPPGTRFRVVRPQEGPRYYVFDPRTSNYAYVDAAAVEPVPEAR